MEGACGEEMTGDDKKKFNDKSFFFIFSDFFFHFLFSFCSFPSYKLFCFLTFEFFGLNEAFLYSVLCFLLSCEFELWTFGSTPKKKERIRIIGLPIKICVRENWIGQLLN